MSYSFPKDFLFGAGICDYQHFGGSSCDLPSIEAAKHLIYYKEDFKILERLGLTAFRTSIEWARIEPEEGKIDEKSLQFYRDYLSHLKSTGAALIVTLHHFTNPKWIHKYGGWLSEKVSERFLKYVDLVAQEFNDDIDYYIVINEPTIYTQFAYLKGETGFPPFHINQNEAKACIKNMNETVQKSCNIIHERCKKAKVGLAHAASFVELEKWRRQLRRILGKIGLANVPESHIEELAKILDFIGINYYYKRASHEIRCYPEGLRKICTGFFREFRKPILITENGLSTRDDLKKTAYLFLHLASVHNSIRIDKSKIIGYCWWSFLHGYEWGFGYNPFFGLVNVDVHGDYKRSLTMTAYEYSKIVRSLSFSEKTYKEKYLPLKESLRFENLL